VAEPINLFGCEDSDSLVASKNQMMQPIELGYPVGEKAKYDQGPRARQTGHGSFVEFAVDR
jgi:hypothetical protein